MAENVAALLDTSVIVRYLTNDPPALASAATKLIDGDGIFLVTDAAIAETGFVLAHHYGIERIRIVKVLGDFLGRDNIRTLDRGRERVIRSLAFCAPSSRVSFADALIWAAAAESGSRTVYSFDRKFPRDGIEVRRPG